MTAPEASPLPWHFDDGFIKDVCGKIVDMREVNASIIIAAVNSHAPLLAAAKEMLSAIATRDIGSFTWESRAAKALKAAIAAAEEHQTWTE